MAQAVSNNVQSNFKYLTDCMYFISGHCKLNDTCEYRHCFRAVNQTKNCPKWPMTCRNTDCLYRHPATASRTVSAPSKPGNLVSFFWDIENVPIPKGQKPFDIVERIRQKLVVDPGLQEADFSCYCNSATITEANSISLHHANVRIVHLPDRKPGAADRQIMLDLIRFERIHRPPATVVLISGDIDFIGILNGLRHQAGFHVIVIHNKPAREELKATVHEHYPWELFTLQDPHRPVPPGNAPELHDHDRASRAPQVDRRRHASRNRSARRRDPSPHIAARPSPPAANADIKKYLCPKCPNVFDSIQSLQQHQTAKKHLFYCPVCNDSFNMELAQNQHQKDKNHHVLDYRCAECNRFFAKSESLQQHQQATGHTTSVFQSAKSDSVRRRPNLPPMPSANGSGNVGDPLMVILQGIEAIKDHYGKRLPTRT